MTLADVLFLLAVSVFLVNAQDDICTKGEVDPMPAMKTHFLLWTRRNPKIFEELLIGDVLSLTLSNYVRTNPTRIYVHGWTENGQNRLSRNLRDGFLLREDCNFIAVDWSFLALPLSYPTAASNVQPVGVLTGNLVNFLISQGADQSQFHLMGFSMGAHVVGRAGLTTNGRLPRITGFDPAFPCFDQSEAEDILDKTDAQFVDIIHTNAGTILDKRLGFPLALGHVDFWPNGGSLQPGCGLIQESTGVKIENILDVFIKVPFRSTPPNAPHTPSFCLDPVLRISGPQWVFPSQQLPMEIFSSTQTLTSLLHRVEETKAFQENHLKCMII
ncbi:hypothetical protein OUZ56_031851 [Daphnia magna]|uniref:Lipase domain-containing protein n=1 Tax=Daphnia magna TaxID=35525 RepID=A0ABQ9ZVT3_9CRUS|nr:hypothetical protein OUZ56_031851 [Daphnia magna]